MLTLQKLQLSFLTEWFVRLLQSGTEKVWQATLEDETERAVFRDELAALQEELHKYSGMLANIADVEDLTELEKKEGAE